MADLSNLPPPPSGYTVSPSNLPPPPAGYTVSGGQSTPATPSQPQGSPLSRLGSAFWEGIGGKALMDIMGGASRSPDPAIHQRSLDTVKGMVQGLANEPARVWDQLKQTGAAMVQGDVPGAASHLGQSVPVVGAGAGQVQHDFENGDYATGFGHALGLLLPFAAGAIPKGTKVPLTPALTNPNPTEAAALDYLAQKGVPVPAGARTGNQFVKNIQKATDVTPLGAVVAQRSEAATTQALQSEAGNLASRANPAAVVPEQAGASVRGALTKSAEQSAQDAETSYATFRQLEQQNPMPVDVTQIKAQLGPIYKEMNSWMQPALRNASAGYQAIKSILEGPDTLAASQAEAGLSGLKALAREGAGRNAGLAKYVVPQLQDAIDGSVAAVDPHALIELRAGRTMAATQYGTQAILDDIRTEPVQAFNQMTWSKDAGIDMLRKVNAEAPGEMPKLGRAWLENAFTQAQQEGGFGHAAKLYNDWANLGPQTKKLLFTPALASDLDKFFLGAKTLAENPNPSGTAVLGISGATGGLIFTHPATGIPLALGAGALSKMLHSPAGVQALLNGMKVPLTAPGAGLAFGQLMKAASSSDQSSQRQAPTPAPTTPAGPPQTIGDLMQRQ